MTYRLDALDVLVPAKGNAGAHSRDEAFDVCVIILGENLLDRRAKCNPCLVAAANGAGVLLKDGNVYPMSLEVEAVQEAGERAAYLVEVVMVRKFQACPRILTGYSQ